MCPVFRSYIPGNTAWHAYMTPRTFAVSYTHLDVYKRQVLEGLEVVTGTVGGRLEKSPEEVRPAVAKGETEDRAARLGIEQRRAFAGEVRQLSLIHI